jgi:hypothetical protein
MTVLESTPPTRMSQVSMFPGTRGRRSVIVLMPRMSTLVGRSHRIYFLWLGEDPQESAQTRRTPVQPPYRIFNSPDISLNDVSFTSMTAHGDGLRRRQECYEFRCFLEPRRCHGSDASNVYIRTGRPLIYSMAGQESRRNQRKLGGRKCDHRTEYSQFSIFRSTTCPFP